MGTPHSTRIFLMIPLALFGVACSSADGSTDEASTIGAQDNGTMGDGIGATDDDDVVLELSDAAMGDATGQASGPDENDVSEPTPDAVVETSQDATVETSQDAAVTPTPDSALEPDTALSPDTASDLDTASTADMVSTPDVASSPDTVLVPEDDAVGLADGTESSNAVHHELELLFNHVEMDSDFDPLIQSSTIQLPPDLHSVSAQIQVRGDLDSFPMAFISFLVEQDGQLKQCNWPEEVGGSSPVGGMPQPPNNILDDQFRIAFPLPENLTSQSIFYPSYPPYDFQPLPCEDVFLGKNEIEVGFLAWSVSAPGEGNNQGAAACGGEGCPNDVILKLRFHTLSGVEDAICVPGSFQLCTCDDGESGMASCSWDGSQFDDCVCPSSEVQDAGSSDDDAGSDDSDATGPVEPPALGMCENPLAFELSAENPSVEITRPGNALQAAEFPAYTAACPTSKPPFALEYFYSMHLVDDGNIDITITTDPQPWDVNQFWLDMLATCTLPWQCSASYAPLTGQAVAGDYIVGLTLAPPNEVYIPEQDFWEFTLKAEWSPLLEGDD